MDTNYEEVGGVVRGAMATDRRGVPFYKICIGGYLWLYFHHQTIVAFTRSGESVAWHYGTQTTDRVLRETGFKEWVGKEQFHARLFEHMPAALQMAASKSMELHEPLQEAWEAQLARGYQAKVDIEEKAKAKRQARIEKIIHTRKFRARLQKYGQLGIRAAQLYYDGKTFDEIHELLQPANDGLSVMEVTAILKEVFG